MDFKVSAEIRCKAHKVCQEYIGGIWKDVLPEDIIIECMTKGLSNRLFKCSLPQHIKATNKEPLQLIMRIFLNIVNQDEFARMRENIVFALLAQKGLAPQLYGVFEDGRLEEYIPSKSLKPKDLHNVTILKALAQKVAHFHLFTPPLDKNQSKKSQVIAQWLTDILTNPKYRFGNDAIKQSKLDKLLALSWQEEAAWLQTMYKSSNSPLVFCHHDLQINNILLRKDKEDDVLQLLDFEFSNYGPRGNDFASAYCSFCIDYTYPEPPYFKMDWNQFPSEEEQKIFISSYLEEFHKYASESVDIVNEAELLLEEPKIFILFQHFITALHGVGRNTSHFNFDWLEYSLQRFDIYLQLKKKYFGQ